MESILQKEKRCYICGTTFNLHLHHVFAGSRRKLSDQDGCVCYLCMQHHIGTYGVHNFPKLDKELKQKCERAWLKRYRKSVEEFIERYGKNYLP